MTKEYIHEKSEGLSAFVIEDSGWSDSQVKIPIETLAAIVAKCQKLSSIESGVQYSLVVKMYHDYDNTVSLDDVYIEKTRLETDKEYAARKAADLISEKKRRAARKAQYEELRKEFGI